MYCSFSAARAHHAALPAPRRVWGLFLIVVLLMGATTTPAQSQDVPLTMQYHSGLDASGPLPADTEVLVYYERGDASTMLSERGGRSAMHDSLTASAEAAFAATYDRLSDDGTTRSIQVPTSPRHRAYVLARVPDGASGPRFYETQLAGNEATSPPDLDRVVTGNMRMVPVGDTTWAAATFEAALQHRSVALALQLPGSAGFGAGATARVWILPAGSASTPNPETLQAGDAQEVAVTVDGTTEMSVARTAYSGEAVYVIVRAPGDEGEPVFYESEVQAVTGDALPMERVDQTDRAAIAALFPGSGSEGGGISWLFYGLVGGLVLVIAVVVAARALSGRGKAKKNQRRQESMRERFRQGTSKLLNAGSEQSATGPESGTDVDEASTALSDARAKLEAKEDEIAALQQEVDAKTDTIATLREKLEAQQSEPKQELQEAARPNPQKNGSARPPKPQPQGPTTGEKIGKAFAEWCTNGSPAMVDRHQLFGRQVESEIASASFRRIMRENNAAGLVFDDNAQDPVEYWLVEARGTAYLLPQPTRNGFRELGECFDGQNVSPTQVRTVCPAELKRRGSGFTLEKKGRVE